MEKIPFYKAHIQKIFHLCTMLAPYETKKMQIEKLQDTISNDLGRSARSYFYIGLDAFFKRKSSVWSDFQPAIGNLTIAIELLLKSAIAKRALSHLFTNLPDELRMYLHYPNSVSGRFKSDRYYADISALNYKTIEFDKAVSYFYLMFPEGKTEFRKLLSNLSELRNQSVHCSVPNFKQYELERLAYLSIKLFTYFATKNVMGYFEIILHEKTNGFMSKYKDEQVTKVKKAVEDAQQKVKNNDISRETIGMSDWQAYVVKCPVCGSDAICEGETENEIEDGTLFLTFWADNFQCESCGLTLDNPDELSLAGIEPVIDRSIDSDEWLKENDGNPEHPYY